MFLRIFVFVMCGELDVNEYIRTPRLKKLEKAVTFAGEKPPLIHPSLRRIPFGVLIGIFCVFPFSSYRRAFRCQFAYGFRSGRFASLRRNHPERNRTERVFFFF